MVGFQYYNIFLFKNEIFESFKKYPTYELQPFKF
jgi:hypothetical protein